LFYVVPLQTLARRFGASDATLFLALAHVLLVAWMLAALALRRAADADVSGWTAALALAPGVQIPVMLVLSLLPSRTADPGAPMSGRVDAMDAATAAQGLISGLALTVFSVAVGALVFGSYGYTMLVVSPFLIGSTTGYFANRRTSGRAHDGAGRRRAPVGRTVIAGVGP